MSYSDWIAIAGIIVNAIIGVWIACTIQNKLSNRRAYKDYLITDIKDIKDTYKNYLNKLMSNRTAPKSVLPWFKAMNNNIEDIINNLEIPLKKHNILKELQKYHSSLRDLITEDEEYKNNFNEEYFNISSELCNKFIEHQGKYKKVFSKIVKLINEY